MSNKIIWPDPYVPYYTAMPELNEDDQCRKDLNTSLQTVARDGNLIAMKYLLSTSAMANAKNEHGMTPLQEALQVGQPLMNLPSLTDQTRTELYFLLKKCKILVDHGAILEPADFEKLEGMLRSIGAYNTRSLHCFMLERPRVGDTEVFKDGYFQSLTRWTAKNLDKQEVVLFNIGDEEFSPYYGAVTKMFHSGMNPFYANIARHFIVLRSRVDSPNDLPVILNYVEEILGANRVTNYIVDSHARRRLVAFGQENVWDSEGSSFMQDVSARLPADANIHMAGCLVAKGTTDNFCWAFSQQSNHRCVQGSDQLVSGMAAKIFHNNGPKLALFYESDMGPPHVKIYQNGRLIVRSALTGEDVPDEVVRAMADSGKATLEPPVEVVTAKKTPSPTRGIFNQLFSFNWNPGAFLFSRS
jgi:hypothetical protein